MPADEISPRHRCRCRFLVSAVALIAAAATPVAAQQAVPPCDQDPHFHELDFALGEWIATNTAGTPRATVRMEKVLDGCAISDQWIRPAGEKGNGLALLSYSRLFGRWTYAWASDRAVVTYFTGHQVEPGHMLFATEEPTATGRHIRRWSLSRKADGGVRELSLGSDDGGKSWSTEYDIHWSRKPS